MNNLTFDGVSIGKRFKMTSNIIYKKISTKEAQVVVNALGNEIKDGAITTSFYKSKMIVNIVK